MCRLPRLVCNPIRRNVTAKRTECPLHGYLGGGTPPDKSSRRTPLIPATAKAAHEPALPRQRALQPSPDSQGRPTSV